MGSWDAACGLTNLPIRYGDKVLAIYHDDTCPIHTTDIYLRISHRQFGHYDTYGGVKEFETDDPATCLYRYDALVALGLFNDGDFDQKELSSNDVSPALNMQMLLRRGIPTLTGQQIADKEELHLHRECALKTIELCDKLISEYPDYEDCSEMD